MPSTGTVGWIECTPYAVNDAGDHYLVLGRVTDLAVSRPVQPLLFFQGGYGRFTPRSLVAVPERDLITGAWWMTVFPGLGIFLTVLAFNLMGDGLRDALDPRHRKR